MRNGTAAYSDPITVMTYDEFEDIREGMNARRKMRVAKDRKNRAKYYSRQRIMGAMIMFVGISCLIIGQCMAADVIEYFGAAIGLFGLYVVATKNMVLIDEYYLARQDRFNEY